MPVNKLPEDIFEMDDPDRTAAPVASLKTPWLLDADRVAAMGLGVDAAPAMSGNANSYVLGGLYYCSSSVTNAPWPGAKNSAILVISRNSTNVVQFAVSVDGGVETVVRQCVSGTWGSWLYPYARYKA